MTTITLPDVPAGPAGPVPPEVRVRPRSWTAEGVWTVAGSAVGALGLTWLLFERLLPGSGVVGFWLTWYGVFLVAYVGLCLLQWGRATVTDRLASVLFTSAGVAVTAAILLVIGYTAIRGWRALRPSFFTSTMSTTQALSPLSSGGIFHAMVGSLEQIVIAIAVSVPLGIAAAVYLNEVGGRFAALVRMVVDAMTAIPSIVAGLFILATVVLSFGFNKSGLAAALAISVMMLPIVTRASEVVLRLVPQGLREASYAMGASHWRTVWSVVLPTARSGLTTAVVLGIARGIGETAPVLLVAGFTAELNWSPLHSAQINLPLYVFTYVTYPENNMIVRAYGAALALLVVVLVLFVLARLLGGNAPGQLSRRQRRRLDRQQGTEPGGVA